MNLAHQEGCLIEVAKTGSATQCVINSLAQSLSATHQEPTVFETAFTSIAQVSRRDGSIAMHRQPELSLTKGCAEKRIGEFQPTLRGVAGPLPLARSVVRTEPQNNNAEATLTPAFM
jgi:hypothetical protein